MKVENTNLKSVLIDFLRFGIWQIQNDKCTYEQMRSIAETIPHPSLWMLVLQSKIIYLSLPLSC